MDIAQWGVYAFLFLGLYFEVFLLITFLEKRPAKKSATKPHHHPSVAILVPSFNEERTIAATLDSLLALEYPKDKLQIVVVDDGSKDNTCVVAKQYAATHPQISYFYKENGGKYTALNFGIAHTTTELVGCLDADSFALPDALIEAVKRFEEDREIMAVVPAMKVHHPKNPLERMQAVEYTLGIFIKKMCDNLAALHVIPGPFSIYRREVFGKIGAFHHAHNTEDMEIAFRMHEHGLKIANAHTAFVYTTVPKTVRALLKQRTRWSQGFLQNLRDYKHMLFNPRFGNFGMAVLPFGLVGFFSGLYTASYAMYRMVSMVVTHSLDRLATGIPFHFSLPSVGSFEWYYLNTSMLVFLILTALALTIISISLGKRIADTRFGVVSWLSYFALFGLVAPLWLARATWGAIRSQETSWR